MKTILLALAAGLAAAAMAAAQTQIRLAARTEVAARDTDKLWETDYGSYNRDVYQIRLVSAAIEVTKGGGKGKIIVQWIGKDKARNSKAVLVSRNEKEIDLAPGRHPKIEFSEVFSESDDKSAALGTRQRDGHRYGGWIVRVVDASGAVLAEQSSSNPYLKKFPVDQKPDPRTVP